MIHLRGRMSGCLFALIVGSLIQGCGLLYDAAALLKPLGAELSDELDVICQYRRLQIGIAVEPFPPFVFPVVWTEQGPWVTGLDIELVQEIAGALSRYCGGPTITVVPHLVHFRDLFVLLTESRLDMFISAVAYNTPHPTAAGLGFSTPYYYDAGIGGVTRRPEVAARTRATLGEPSTEGGLLLARKKALTGLTVAAQEGRSPHLYAEAELKEVRLVVCDTLLAALESRDPPVDVVLGKQPILNFLLRRDHEGWQPLVLENGQPFLLTREFFTVVMAENSFLLQSLVNNLLFELEQTGRLAAMRRRWFDEDYTYTERAVREGLLATPSKAIQRSEQGRCRWAK